MKQFIEEIIKGVDFNHEPLIKAEYEDCHFESCSGLERHFSQYHFSDCLFVDCDFSNSHWSETKFQNCRFQNCKLLGTQFEKLSNFGLSVDFEHCKLNHSSFFGMDLGNFRFEDCEIQNCEFSEAKMVGTPFRRNDVLLSNFNYCDLRKSDWRGSINISLDPRQNQLSGAQFSKESLVGLLAVFKIVVDE